MRKHDPNSAFFKLRKINRYLDCMGAGEKCLEGYTPIYTILNEFSGPIGSWINFFFFWLHWVFVAARGLSLVVASGGYSSLQCMGFSLRWLLLLRALGARLQ